MKLVTYVITPKFTPALNYKYVTTVVEDPLVVLLGDSEYYHYIINVLDLNDEQAAELSGGTTEL